MILRAADAFMRHMLHRIGMDRAVVYGMLGTVQLLLTGPVTALIIAFSLTREVQGYFYTFAALLALQVFIEMGFAQVIVQFASHEWAHLRMLGDRSVDGDADAHSRLSSLALLATKWYWRASVVLGIGLVAAGLLFFSAEGSDNVNWRAPWIAIAVLTAVDFALLPLWSLLQGANQMAAVNHARLISNMLLIPMLWGSLVLGAGLWAVALGKVVSLSWELGFIVRYRAFFRSLLRRRAGPTMQWRREILPVQWRIALTWMTGYFAAQIFVPVIFHFDGAVEAGRWGMTWGLVTAVAGLSTTWIYTRAPAFGALIAQRRYAELDASFRKVTVGAITLCIAMSVLGVALVAAIHASGLRLGERILPTGTAALLFAATILMQTSLAQSTYLRAHKAEPFLALTIVTSACLAVITPLFAATWGTTGVAAGYLGVTAVFVLPWSTRLFLRLRRKWHAPEFAADDAPAIAADGDVRMATPS
jgi:hypothetical protein